MKRKITILLLASRRASTNPYSSVPSNQEAEDHLSDVADRAVETRIKEEEEDHTEIKIAGDLKENVTIVAWKLSCIVMPFSPQAQTGTSLPMNGS